MPTSWLRSRSSVSAIVACVSAAPSASTASTAYAYGLKPAPSNSSIAASFIEMPTRARRKPVQARSSTGSAAACFGPFRSFSSEIVMFMGISVADAIVARVDSRQIQRLETQMASLLDSRKRWFVLAMVVAAQFMVVLDVAIVNVALPSIKTDLNFSQESLQWVITAYSILFGGVLLLGGRLADLLGRRRMFMAGLLLFTVSSLLDGLSWSEGSLIAFRALQGLGAALLSPAALSILTTTFREGRERNVALGIWGAASGSGGAAGVLLGGALTSALSWSWIFFINVPVGVAVIALSPVLLKESRADLDHRHFDTAGAASITGGLMLLVYAMTRATQHGWGTPSSIALLGGSAALIAAFFVIEHRSTAPLLPLRIFRLRTLTASNASGLTLGGAVFSQFFLLTLYMQQVLGYSAI